MKLNTQRFHVKTRVDALENDFQLLSEEINGLRKLIQDRYSEINEEIEKNEEEFEDLLSYMRISRNYHKPPEQPKFIPLPITKPLPVSWKLRVKRFLFR